MSLTTTRTAPLPPGEGTDPDGLCAAVLPALPPDLSTAVSQARDGDEDAFRALYSDIQPRLLRYLWALVGTDAEDVASETWLQVSRDLPGFRGDSAGFRGWVTTIARHRATDHLRALGCRPRPAAVRPDELESWAAHENTEDHALESVSTDKAIALIARLPRDQAEAVLLHVVVGLDAPQAGRMLGKRPGAVRTSCYRGLRKLSAMVNSRAALGAVPVPLALLLRAAAAPGRASELARLEQAVAAYRAQPGPAKAPPGPAPGSSVAGPVSVKVLSAVLAVVVGGGVAVTASTLSGAGPVAGSSSGHPGRGGGAADSVRRSAHAPPAARRSGSVPSSARPGAGPVAGACQSLAAGVLTATTGPASAGSRGSTAGGLEQALASPVAGAVLGNRAFGSLVSAAGGDANVAGLCAVALKLPTMAVAAARLPGSVLAALPVSLLAQLPASVLARLPVSTLVHLPASVLAKLPTSVLRKLPASVLRKLPVAVLRGLPGSVLRTLPGAGVSGVAHSAAGRLPAFSPGQLPSLPQPAPLPVQVPVSVPGSPGHHHNLPSPPPLSPPPLPNPLPHLGVGNPVGHVVRGARGVGRTVHGLGHSLVHDLSRTL